jgi:hypothetical protein
MSIVIAAKTQEASMRAGSFAQFERRFGVTDVPDEDGLILWSDLPEGVDRGLVWTVVEDGDVGKEYLIAGISRVNRVGYVIAENPRRDSAAEYRTYRF